MLSKVRKFETLGTQLGSSSPSHAPLPTPRSIRVPEQFMMELKLRFRLASGVALTVFHLSQPQLASGASERVCVNVWV